MTKADGACSTLTLLKNTLVEFQNNFLGYPKNVISHRGLKLDGAIGDFAEPL